MSKQKSEGRVRLDGQIAPDHLVKGLLRGIGVENAERQYESESVFSGRGVAHYDDSFGILGVKVFGQHTVPLVY